MTEHLFKTFEEAEGWEHLYVHCDTCAHLGTAVLWETPLEAHFYGPPGGYHKPSPTQRHSYSKTNREGNPGGTYGYQNPTRSK